MRKWGLGYVLDQNLPALKGARLKAVCLSGLYIEDIRDNVFSAYDADEFFF